MESEKESPEESLRKLDQQAAELMRILQSMSPEPMSHETLVETVQSLQDIATLGSTAARVRKELMGALSESHEPQELVARITENGNKIIELEPSPAHRLLTVLTLLDFELRAMLESTGLASVLGIPPLPTGAESNDGPTH